MLIITFHNDSTGNTELAHYDVQVLITETPTQLRPIWTGRIEGHHRGDGWKQLLVRLVEEAHKGDHHENIPSLEG